MHIHRFRGCVAATGDDINHMANAAIIPVPKQDGHYHVTLIAKHELQALSTAQLSILHQHLENDGHRPSADLINLGIASAPPRTVFFNVVVWPHGDVIRARLGLERKAFHITLSEQDDHSPGLVRDATAILDDGFNTELSGRDFDAAFLAYFLTDRLEAASWLVRRFRSLHRTMPVVHIRLADVSARKGRHTSAVLLYAFAAGLPDVSEKMFRHCIVRICKAARFAEFPGAFAEDAKSEIESLILDDEFPEYATIPTPRVRTAIREYYAEGLDTMMMTGPNACLPLSLPSRERMHVCSVDSNGDVEIKKMPRFFRWLAPYRLAVMSTPRNADDVKILHAHFNITLIVTLTQETPLPETWFEGTAVRNVFMPVENYKAPTTAQVDHFLGLVAALPEREAALVHCGGGKGRAGTFAACYMARYGFEDARPIEQYDVPHEAAAMVRILRHMRPGSIETDEQEAFVGKYVRHLWKSADQASASASGSRISEPTPTDLKVDGQFPTRTRTIVLCGLPGSGKSSFARSLACSDPTIIVVSQDDLGSRSSYLNALSTASKSGRRVVVDKCNPTSATRKEALAMAFDPEDALCVYFEYGKALCTQRADARTDHPTVKQGSAGRIVARFDKEMVVPRIEEGFVCVATVTSFEAAGKLLAKLGCQDGIATQLNVAQPIDVNVNVIPTSTSHITKFPRTRHLFDMGSATRDDLVLSSHEVSTFLSQTTSPPTTLILEEKIDGANLGISIDATTHVIHLQNRSHRIDGHSHAQFRRLPLWIERHDGDLRKVVRPGRDVLYGEWMFAKHSIHYQRLPDTFLVFDLLDRHTSVFLSRDALQKRLRDTDLVTVPRVPLPDGTVTAEVLKRMVETTRSRYYDGVVEGLYIRKERDGKVVDRAKLVRTDFIAGNEHWSKGIIMRNGVVDAW
ncbi:hypothetical protein HKX48_001969, partial [Thoreauomyces humboldtii]